MNTWQKYFCDKFCFVCIAVAVGVCLGAWFMIVGRQEKPIAIKPRHAAPKKLNLSNVVIPVKRHTNVRSLSLGRHLDNGFVRHEMGMQRAAQENLIDNDIGEGEVITLSLLKGTMGEREIRRNLVQVRDNDEASFLEAMQTMMQSEEVEKRKSALMAIGILYSGESAPKEPDDGDDVALSAEARRMRGIVEIVRDGLRDADAIVRKQAIMTARRVEGDASGIIASQVMRGEDTDLKILFLEETIGKATDSDMAVSLMGMSSTETEVRAMSAANLKDLTGVDFKTSEEAQKWWEENHIAFLSKVEGISADVNVAEAVGPSGVEGSSEDLSTNDKEQTTNKRKE